MRRADPLSRRWQVEDEPDPALTAVLADSLNVPALFARLLVQRGFTTPEAARSFLRPSRHDLHPPSLLPDMDVALDRLMRAARARETVLVHGDYDVDGQCAAAIVTRALSRVGARPVPFVPHRLRDGYDLSEAGVNAAAAAGATLIVTLDSGTTAVEAIADARRRGMDVIVVDHHLPGPVRPKALAMINPRRPESTYPFPDLCGAGLAWKLALEVIRAAGLAEGWAWHLLDLAALATVADLVPLQGENRIIVRLGLKVMRTTRWPGLAALLTESGLANRTLRASHMAFVVAPRLNAAGRVGDATDGLRLLLTDQPGEAAALAQRLSAQNAERQALDQRTLDEALEDLDAWYDPSRDIGVVIAREGWHPGVIGIVASRVVEQIARPVFLVAFDGEVGKGSGRSVGRCDLHRALATCAPHLERWGGHRMAAGLTLRRDRLDAFRADFNAACAVQLDGVELVPSQRIDAVVRSDALTWELERLLGALEPAGLGNPGPVFGLEGLALATSPQNIGERHVRLTFADRGGKLRAVAWGLREEVERVLGESRGPYRAAIRLERDSYLGIESLEGRLLALAAD
jgi:single-stranded-DNA-specific exonuclease